MANIYGLELSEDEINLAYLLGLDDYLDYSDEE